MYTESTALPSNKSFGLFFSTIFFIVALYFWYTSAPKIAMAGGAISLFMVSATIFKPSLLNPLNRGWYNLGLGLSIIISPVIMGIIYFCIFTPTAIFLRLLGRDELKLNEKNKISHWQDRPITSGLRRSHFYDQF